MENDQSPLKSELVGKERYEAEKAERLAVKATNQKTAQRAQTRSRATRYIFVILVIAAVVAGIVLLTRRSVPEGPDQSRVIPEMGRSHIEVGASHEPYNSNPPTSGPHYAEPARAGFREEPIADEHLVHSLEHGLIWISYHPRVGDEVRNALREFAGSWVVVTSREANDMDIALAAWGRLDAFNLQGGATSAADEQRIQDFISRYRNRGPERIPAGQHGGI